MAPETTAGDTATGDAAVPGGQPQFENPVERWKARFRASRTSLPSWAKDAPHRQLFVSNASGTFELYTWDRVTGATRQVTDRPNGTYAGALDPSGESVWWFADTDGDEFGVWMRQPFAGGPDVPATPLEPSYPAGLSLRPGLVAVGRSTDQLSTVHLLADGEPERTVYSSPENAAVVGLSRDGTLLCISHSEHGDAMKPALRVLRVSDGSTVGELWDGPGKGVDGVGFSPVAGDPRVLVVHEREGQRRPLLWDSVRGCEQRVDPDLPGEFDADWYPDGTALLLHHDYRGRSELYRYQISSGELTRIETPPGTVSSATARPDGALDYLWSSAAAPPQLRTLGSTADLLPVGRSAPPSVPVTDVDVDGPGGRIHSLLAVPEGAQAPYPAVFLIHGGPMAHDGDSFASDRAAWVDMGFAVVQVNYRGSTGYGAPWQDAINGRPGLTELEDLVAVRQHLVDNGTIDRDRVALAGGSWGGYLTLLGLGCTPDLWAAGAASVPVADYVAAYEDEMDALQAIDRSLFGGSPDEVPERYAASSPISYVQQVQAPVLVLAGANDPRCPLRQIENYLERLAQLGKPHEVYRFDAGHGSLVVEERIRQMEAEIDFVRRHVPA